MRIEPYSPKFVKNSEGFWCIEFKLKGNGVCTCDVDRTVPSTPPTIYPAKIKIESIGDKYKISYMEWEYNGQEWVLKPVSVVEGNTLTICPRIRVDLISLTFFYSGGDFETYTFKFRKHIKPKNVEILGISYPEKVKPGQPFGVKCCFSAENCISPSGRICSWQAPLCWTVGANEISQNIYMFSQYPIIAPERPGRYGLTVEILCNHEVLKKETIFINVE